MAILGKIVHYPSLAIRHRNIYPAYNVIPQSKNTPLALLRQFARETAIRDVTYVYLLLHEKRCLVFTPEGNQIVTSAPGGYLCIYCPGWNGIDNEVEHGNISYDSRKTGGK